VILSGPLPRLQSLTAQDVKVIADLFGLEPGMHKVKPTIVVPEGLSVESVLPDTVEVEIGIVRSLTPIPTRPPGIVTTPTITATVPLTVTRTR
jgi:hypothetical protein